MTAVSADLDGVEDAAALGAPLLRLAERVLKTLARAEVPAAAGRAARVHGRALAGALPRGHARAPRQPSGATSWVSSVAPSARVATELGMDGLARAGLAPELVEALRALPPDARNGRRLAILADLLETYRLVDARAAEAQRALHLTLGPVPLRRRAERRRRTR